MDVAVYVASTQQGYQLSVEAPKDQAAAIHRVLDGVVEDQPILCAGAVTSGDWLLRCRKSGSLVPRL
jgi:hypothetical protein